MTERIAYKVLLAAEMARFRGDGVFAGSAVDAADGFIHLSCAGQVAETVDRHFAGVAGLMVVAVDLAALGEAVRWESSRGGQLFPHIYGVLPMAAVVGVGALTRRADGGVVLPG